MEKNAGGISSVAWGSEDASYCGSSLEGHSDEVPARSTQKWHLIAGEGTVEASNCDFTSKKATNSHPNFTSIDSLQGRKLDSSKRS